MRRSSVALISLIGPLLLGACTERDSTAPRAIAPGQPNAAVLVAATTCDGNAIKAAQRAYFTSNQDAVIGYVGDMLKAYNAGQYGTANTLIYAIGRQVAAERLTPLTTDAATGGIFLIDVLKCLTNASGQREDISKFEPNATAVVKSGIWEVRGGTGNATVPAAGRVFDTHLTPPARNFGLPHWGVELGTATSWGATQYIVFGYPTTAGTIVGSPANINTNEEPAKGFELGTIPDGTPKAGLRVGECIARTDAGAGQTNRIVHNNTQILEFSGLQTLCDPSLSASAATQNSWYASFLHHAGTLLTPKSAFAQGFLLGTGGLPSDWSPFAADAITASAVQLSFVPPTPINFVVDVPQTWVVKAAIGSAGVPGVVVTIAIAGNSGQSAGALFNNNPGPASTFVTGTTVDCTLSTDPNCQTGTVAITFSLGKAGGYTLSTTGGLDGYAVGNTLNTAVWVKNP